MENENKISNNNQRSGNDTKYKKIKKSSTSKISENNNNNHAYCINCVNLSKNLLYIENLLRMNGHTCRTCQTVIKFVNNLNHNIAEVFNVLNYPPHQYIVQKKLKNYLSPKKSTTTGTTTRTTNSYTSSSNNSANLNKKSINNNSSSAYTAIEKETLPTAESRSSSKSKSGSVSASSYSNRPVKIIKPKAQRSNSNLNTTVIEKIKKSIPKSSTRTEDVKNSTNNYSSKNNTVSVPKRKQLNKTQTQPNNQFLTKSGTYVQKFMMEIDR